jgi:ATP/maltotriose-dependent transcriptional regulator MalT
MDQGTAETGTSSSHIVGRPRLLQLLDASGSPLILLVAPAGYGKTTLARQWVESRRRRAIWHHVSLASTDLAVLASSVAEALSPLFPDAADLMTERLRAGRETDADPELLADAFSKHIAEWPGDTWLVLDDYQNLMESITSERFVSRLTGFASMLIISRRRPSWMTARRLLYGEAREFGVNSLAMTDAEAAALLKLPNEDAASGLVSLAAGWPAVIGLAALTPRSLATVSEALPETLHDYFAEELFQTFPDALKPGLAELSLAPTISAEIAEALVGDDADALLEQAVIHGFLTTTPAGYSDIHPLLRKFLRTKLDLSDERTRIRIASVVSHLMGRRAWDDAFAVLQEADRMDLLSPLMGAALGEMLRAGRMATVRRWLAASEQRGITSPQLDLARAEISFREGRHDIAEMEALEAARGLHANHALYSRALYRAAQSAQLADRASDALALHQEAARTAQTTNDRRQAIWGQFVTHAELSHRDDALATIVLFERSQPSSIEDKLRQAQAHLSSAIRWGGITTAIRSWRHRLELVESPCDPLVKTGFLQMLGTALVLGAEYAAALEVAELERMEAERLGLNFVVPHALCMRANAETGLRRQSPARKTLRTAYDQATKLMDNHSLTNARVIDAKLLLAQAKPADALAILQFEPAEWPNLVMQAEFIAMRALAAACGHDWSQTEAYARESSGISDQVEAELPARWATAIARLRSKDDASDLRSTYDRAQETGHLDSIVSSYRAYPPILRILSADEERSPGLVEIVAVAGDRALAKRFDVPIRNGMTPSGASLTSRERQVAGLLCQGFSNAEIAKALWIEESTAKVHVQHILRKLRARSRTEAAIRIAEEGLNSPD